MQCYTHPVSPCYHEITIWDPRTGNSEVITTRQFEEANADQKRTGNFYSRVMPRSTIIPKTDSTIVPKSTRPFTQFDLRPYF